MARKRMIDPSFWRDEKIAQCTHMERLLFQGLWTFAEDSGVGRANPLLIKADIFPYDTLREADIKRSLDKLSSLGLIKLYEADGQHYYMVKNFLKHQTINRPSQCTLPMPQNGDDITLTEHSLNAHGALTPKEKLIEEKIKEKAAAPARDYIQFFSQNIGVISPTIATEAESYITDDGMEDGLVTLALKRAVDNGAKNWKYAKAILGSWLDKGIKTVGQAEAEEVEFKQRSSKGKTGQATSKEVLHEIQDLPGITRL